MTTAAIATIETRELARGGDDEWSVERMVAQSKKIQECMNAVMIRDEHYGVIPGTQGRDGKPAKPTLLKAGAEKLCLMFRLSPKYEIVSSTETRELISFTIRCLLEHIPTGAIIATGLGSCNSRESKYLRPAPKKCPLCSKETIFKSKQDSGGWYCWNKKGGCGAQFKDGDEAIEKQDGGIADPADLHNTILKMGCKRSLVAAVLNGTAASDCFSQDLDDLTEKAAEYTPPPAKEEAKASSPKDTSPRTGTSAPVVSARTAPVQGTTTTTGEATRTSSVSSQGTSKDYVPANTIKVAKGDKMVSVELGKEVIALVAETLDDSTFRETWLRPYKTHEGVQVGSVSQLTEAQAENIRRRLVVQRDRNKVRHERGEAEMAGNLTSMLETPRAPKAERAPMPRNLDDAIQATFTNEEDERTFLLSYFGVEHVRELDKVQAETALALVLAYGTPEFDRVEEKARALGRLR